MAALCYIYYFGLRNLLQKYNIGVEEDLSETVHFVLATNHYNLQTERIDGKVEYNVFCQRYEGHGQAFGRYDMMKKGAHARVFCFILHCTFRYNAFF